MNATRSKKYQHVRPAQAFSDGGFGVKRAGNVFSAQQASSGLGYTSQARVLGSDTFQARSTQKARLFVAAVSQIQRHDRIVPPPPYMLKPIPSESLLVLSRSCAEPRAQILKTPIPTLIQTPPSIRRNLRGSDWPHMKHWI